MLGGTCTGKSYTIGQLIVPVATYLVEHYQPLENSLEVEFLEFTRSGVCKRLAHLALVVEGLIDIPALWKTVDDSRDTTRNGENHRSSRSIVEIRFSIGSLGETVQAEPQRISIFGM